MDGIINVNKPSGLTSHDVVARIRRATRIKRIGHAGTLDPMATGVLLVCLGNATRIVEFLMDWPKEYRATAVFGAETDTEDAGGQILRETNCAHVTGEMVERVLPRFRGKIQQVPPMVSALHHEGRRLYDLAREGRVVERAPRTVEIYSLRITAFRPGLRPEVDLEVRCSKGTYIRTLCADIGRAVDCGAYMAALERSAVGRFSVEGSVSLEEIERAASEGRLWEVMVPVNEALSDMPAVRVSSGDVDRVLNGVSLPAEPAEPGPVRILSPEGTLLAIGSRRRTPEGGYALKPDKVFPAVSDQ